MTLPLDLSDLILNQKEMKNIFIFLAILLILGLFFPNLLSVLVSIFEKLLVLLNELLSKVLETMPR